jgi:hypothetical protein
LISARALVTQPLGEQDSRTPILHSAPLTGSGDEIVSVDFQVPNTTRKPINHRYKYIRLVDKREELDEGKL